MNAGIIVFPGTNCEKDTFFALQRVSVKAEYVFHLDNNSLLNYDMIFLPGGFSYGDYVRSGALAKFSPIIDNLKKYIKEKRGLVVGICNGFQLLLECNLLNGALTYNKNMNFMSKIVEVEFENKILKLPIANKEGRFIKSENFNEKHIFLKYKNDENGSEDKIAGLFDKEKMIIGLMPHPERASIVELKRYDGLVLFEKFKEIIS